MNVFRSCKYCSGPDAPISWWLRTPGENHGTLGAAYVQSGGFINDSGDNADLTFYQKNTSKRFWKRWAKSENGFVKYAKSLLCYKGRKNNQQNDRKNGPRAWPHLRRNLYSKRIAGDGLKDNEKDNYRVPGLHEKLGH